MTVETGFVRDVQDHPDNQDVRLIFCDWLADQDDEDHLARRRLLQIQCDLGNWVADQEQRRNLLAEEAAILDRHAGRWLGDLPTFVTHSQFHNGLVDVTFETSAFLSPPFSRRAEELFDAAWIGQVRIELGRGQVPSLARCATLARLRQLDLSSCALSDEALEPLLTGGLLRELVHLNLANNQLSGQTVALLARSDFPRLRSIDLRNNQVDAGNLRQFLVSPRLPSLNRLHVQGNNLPAATILEVHTWSTERQGIPRLQGLPGRLVNSLGMEFVLIPRGTFLMGSPDSENERSACEGPLHEVEISQPFYLSVGPVTQRQYQNLIGSNPSYFNDGNRGGPHHPVEMVTWGHASTYCEQLTALPAEVAAGRVYRLPTEAQWEHACRAGTFTPFCFGSRASAREVNFDGRHPYGGGRSGHFQGHTTPVGTYSPNGFGLYDTHGNVWEWCSDYYDERFYHRSGRRDPTGPRNGTRVSARGGSWSSHAALCRSASRDYWYGPHYCRDNIGFRIALVVPTELASQ